jgi:hypothetical protein
VERMGGESTGVDARRPNRQHAPFLEQADPEVVGTVYD